MAVYGVIEMIETNESLRRENAVLWQLIEDAAQIIADLQDALDAQRKLLTTFDEPVMVTDYGYAVISTIAQVSEGYRLCAGKYYDENGEEIVRDEP